MNKLIPLSKYDPDKSYYTEFVKEWNKVGCNTYVSKTKKYLDKNVKRSHLGNVSYLINLGIEPNMFNLDYSVKNGDLKLLKYFIEERNIKPHQMDFKQCNVKW